MTTTIAFLTTAWGPKFGGINAFNEDLCRALAAIRPDVHVVCVVQAATTDEIGRAREAGITLVALSEPPSGGHYSDLHKFELADMSRQWPDIRWWIGHDTISGPLAVSVAERTGTLAAVIQHTDYTSYAPLRGVIGSAAMERYNTDVETLSRANVAFGVGPKLAAAALDRLRGVGSPRVVEIVPGLPQIEPLPASSTFWPITFGRMDGKDNRIKQGKLAIHGFAALIREAQGFVGLDPKMSIIGVSGTEVDQDKLASFAHKKAGRVVAILAQPFTEDRVPLFDALRRSSVCLMLSVHEGFGLAGWEAIAAGVPLIVSQNSGLYELLRRVGGKATGCVRTVDIQGSPNKPYYTDRDVSRVTQSLREIVSDPTAAKNDAIELKQLLAEYTWDRAATAFIAALNMDARTASVTDAAQYTVASRHKSVDRPTSAGLPESNLPVTVDSFHGRGELMDRTRTQIVARTTRLFTLVGPVGAGKTRFAQELAHSLLTEFGNHVYFVDLTSVADPSLVVASITRVLRIAAGDPLVDALREYFRGQPALLVLDNFEQVIDAGINVRDLVYAIPSLTVLITSRQPLQVGGEETIDLRPLDLSAAVALFVDRSNGSTNSDAPKLEALCERLDGLPLAIEIVAARARLMSPEELLPELESLILDVRATRKDLPEKQRTMRAAIGWSYQLLTLSERRLLRRLSVFKGGFTLATATAVLSENGRVDQRLANDMDTLIENRLLGADQVQARRFRMLETLQRYAAEHLEADSADAALVRGRHATFFLSAAESAVTPGRSAVPTVNLDRVALELDNHKAAVAWFVDNGLSDQALRMTFVLGQYWWSRNFQEGWELLRGTLALPCPPHLNKWRARVLTTKGLLAIRLGYLSEADRSFAEGLELVSGGIDQPLKAWILASVAIVSNERGHYDDARLRAEEALRIQRAEGDALGAADSLQILGDITYSSGDYSAARHFLDRSLTEYEKLTETLRASWVHLDLARVATAEMKSAPAAKHCALGYQYAKSHKDWGMTAWAENILGYVGSFERDYDTAYGHHQESLKLARLLGDKRPIALALEGFAVLYARRGRRSTGIMLAEAAEALREQVGVPRNVPEARLLESAFDTEESSEGEDMDRARALGRRLTVDEASDLAQDAYRERG